MAMADSEKLFESTTESTKSWKSHHNGLVRLVKARDVDSFADPLSQALLADIRVIDVSASCRAVNV